MESVELTILKLDQVWPGTSRKAKRRNVRHIMVEGSDLDGKGRGREVQGHAVVLGMNEAKNYEDVMNVSISAKLMKAAKEANTERPPLRKVKTKGKEGGHQD